MNEVLLLIVLIYSNLSFAQKDTIWMKDGNKLFGTFKSLTREIVTFSTSNSYDDYRIKWENVAQLKTTNHFKLMNAKGDVIEGRLAMDSTTQDKILVIQNDGTQISIDRKHVNYIQAYKTTFKARTILETSIGFTQAKQHNARQLNLSGKLGYIGKIWEIGTETHNYLNKVDSIFSYRNEIIGNLYIYLPRRFFVYGQYVFLKSSELNLNYRSIPIVGMGNYIVSLKNMHLALILGSGFNEERYLSTGSHFFSSEGFGMLNYEFYPNPDFDFVVNFSTYPNFNVNRVRYDLSTKLKYKYYKNFNISAGYRLNYDTNPGDKVSKFDYLLDLGLGWTLN